MACDDGDVFAFYTHIWNYETRRSDISTKVRDFRPFFYQNVGKSAWGLAIHQRSRLLAVSSNRREITIFVPAISDEVSDDETTEDERPESLPLPGSTAFPNRKKDFTHVISVNVQEANIPSINFVNGDDEEVEWIMAANIKGFAVSRASLFYSERVSILHAIFLENRIHFGLSVQVMLFSTGPSNEDNLRSLCEHKGLVVSHLSFLHSDSYCIASWRSTITSHRASWLANTRF